MEVAGHSGDEQEQYKEFLTQYWERLWETHYEDNVILVFGEDHILSGRDIMVDRKFYRFMDVPAIVAAKGGIGTYFSEIEGYGNNLLEMISMGLPVVINRYDIYKRDIEPLGFDLPSIDNCILNEKLIDEAYLLLNDNKRRSNAIVKNLQVLAKELDHSVITDRLEPLIKTIFDTPS